MKKKGFKYWSYLLICCLLMSFLAGCNKGDSKNPEQTAKTSQPEEIQTIEDKTIIDREGNEIEIPEKMERMISLAPSVTQVLAELGFGDKIVGGDSYSKEVKGVKEGIPVFDMMAPDTEQMVALKPDIIFAAGMSKIDEEDPLKQITDMGIEVSYIPTSNSIEGIKEDILFLGDITKSETKAQEIIKDIDNQIEDILEKVKDVKTKKSVYFEIASAPSPYSFGNNVFLNEMIELLGAANILSDQEGWVAVSEETVLSKNPDVILTNVNYIEDPVGEILGRNGWNVVHAVKNKQVYYIDNNASTQPSQNIVIALEEMAKAIYPELFGDEE